MLQAFGSGVDAMTGRFVAVLRRQPLARLLLLLYLASVHALVYMLLGRMQHLSLAHVHDAEALKASHIKVPPGA